MKRGFVFLTMVLCLFGLYGCKKGNEKKETVIEADFVYPVKESSVFCLDEEGNLYTYVKEENSICAFDKDGVRVKSVKTEPLEYQGLCFGDGVLYAAVSKPSEQEYAMGISLAEISMEDGSQKILYENANAYMVQRLVYCNKRLCFVEKEPINLAEAELLSDPAGEYYYGGERLICYSLETQTAEEVLLERIRTVAKKDASELWIYAYDFDYGKYYFVSYNPETGLFGENSHVGDYFNVFLENFAYDAESDKLLRGDVFKSVLVAMNPKDINSQSSFYSMEVGLSDNNGLVCQDGRSYFLLKGEIHRIKNSNYLKNYAPLKVYYSSQEFEMPEGTGFEMNMVEVDEETMALSMMAGDSDYDFLLLSTESAVAEQIRRVGAYEPLNKVAGVESYLNESFDFMKEAATDENGAVWMLPCDISCEVLVYNPTLCRTYGIDFEKEYSNEVLLSAQRTLENAEKNGNPSYYSYYFLRDRQRQMELYLTDYAVVNGSACFDTELFRKYSKLYLDAIDRESSENFRYAWINPGATAPVYGATEEEVASYYNEYFSKVAFVTADKHRLATEYSSSIGGGAYGLLDYDFFKVKAMPSLEVDKSVKNSAFAFILVLNPNSAHLSEAKEFLSVLTERMNAEESIFRTKELKGEYNALERSVHALYADSRIVFSYPSDVFWDEYRKYLNREKTLEEVIPELERKLNFYLKE